MPAHTDAADSQHITEPMRPDNRARREHILDAAEALFARDGFDNTATSAIARTAGVPKGLVFYYFPTKESILTALLNERMPQNPLADVSSLVAPGDPAGSLLNLNTALNLRGHRSPVLRVILWREAETHPDVREQLARLSTYLFAVTERILAASTPAPIGPGTLRAAATAWVSAMFGAATSDRLSALDGKAPSEGLANVAQILAAGMTQLG